MCCIVSSLSCTANLRSEKDKNQQRVAEQDQLLHEFETLHSDIEGLLGVLQNTLENGDAKFEAKKLLCALFQVSTELK